MSTFDGVVTEFPDIRSEYSISSLARLLTSLLLLHTRLTRCQLDLHCICVAIKAADEQLTSFGQQTQTLQLVAPPVPLLRASSATSTATT